MTDNLPLPHISDQIASKSPDRLQVTHDKRVSASPAALAPSPNMEVQSRLNKRRSSIGMKGRCSRRSVTQINAADLMALVPSEGSDEERLGRLVELCLTYAVRSSVADEDEDVHSECSKLAINNMEDIMNNIRDSGFISNLLQVHTDGMVPPDPELEKCSAYTDKLNAEYNDWKDEENKLKERSRLLKLQIEAGSEEVTADMMSCLSEKDKKMFADIDAEMKTAEETMTKCTESWNLLCDETNDKLYQLNNNVQAAKDVITTHIHDIVEDESADPDTPRRLLQRK